MGRSAPSFDVMWSVRKILNGSGKKKKWGAITQCACAKVGKCYSNKFLKLFIFEDGGGVGLWVGVGSVGVGLNTPHNKRGIQHQTAEQP